MTEQADAKARPEDVIWPWRDGSQKPPHDIGGVRKRAVVQALIALAIAGALLWFDHVFLAGLTVAVSSVGLVAALISPLGAYATVERGLQMFARGVATVVGWLVLVPLFYLFFLPFALLFRRGASDPMRRFYQRSATSYWTDREPVSERQAARRRQF